MGGNARRNHAVRSYIRRLHLARCCEPRKGGAGSPDLDGAHGFRTVAAAHVDAWRRRWEEAEIRIVGDEEAQRALRFATYHLIAAANSADEHVSVAARGLTGEAYRGHVFWDTEIYMLPFYSSHRPSDGTGSSQVSLPHAGCSAAESQGARL